MARIGLVRVLTTNDIHLLNIHGAMIEAFYPTLTVSTRSIPDHPDGVYDWETFKSAVPLVIDAVKGLASEGSECVIVSCASDPGVLESRSAVSVPVIGAGEATGAVAASLGTKVGVIGILPEMPERLREILGPSFLAYIKPPRINRTLDMITPEGRIAVLEAGMVLKNMGADVIALACTAMSTLGILQEMKATTGLRVVDPVLAAGLLAYHAVTF